MDRRKVQGAGGTGTVIAYDPGTCTYSVRYTAGGSAERAISATALTPAAATRGRGQRTTRGQGVARLTAMELGQTTTAPARPMAAEHTWERQCELAEAQYQRHHGKDVVVRPSRVGTGKGLYAARDLQAGWELFYCGRYYATWAHLVAAGRNTGQYTIAEGRNEPHFDGEHVPYNLAKYANHRPKQQANAMLGYEPNYGAVGQPTLTIKEQGVAAGEEITVDYGPRYAYNQHGFDRYAPSTGAGDDDDDDNSSGDTPPTTDAGTVSVAAAMEPLEAQIRRLLGS
jgi:hypothetical protein